ncbi:AarF/ABC1/UbiB kinase family protein [Leptolyngbya sp. FACHB-711]|uniref:ABC1 kinase family protein n=1 Tax=unclassified Leptolyngbya TaxID=2650499 RepID=UPI00168296EE|nr:AarF/ABC1/UbiB kinase family protein [Cyanobacteria bacterium FACHB-502]MBD2026830.1 AarF/ABC1/UbiB kinase family protein [Leptolyngbya sp. FACHB-711]
MQTLPSSPNANAASGLVVESELFPAPQEHLKSVQPNAMEAQQYDPLAIAAYYGRRPFQVVGRLLAIFWSFFGFALSLWWDRQRGKGERNQHRRAVRLREILTYLGPAYIKVGQALSTRPDLVPPAYLEELTRLQDQLPPFPNEIAFQFIQEELGDRPENIYAELSEKPLAAASLGQVYKGKLKSGETVAVKVQRPGLAQQITLDLYILRQLAAWAGRTFKRIRSDLVAIADEFGARIFEEMDYTQEGRNAERFAQLYGNLPDIYVPRIYWHYTQRRVLTMEWITGTKLTQLQEIRAQGIDASYLVDVGVQCSLRQLLEHGFFHADPHPGNLLATPEGKLAYLDFGMMSEVMPPQRYGLIEAIVHLVNRDFDALAQDYVNLEFLTPDTDLTPIIPAFAAVFNEALGASVAEINIKSITDKLSALMYEYPFRVPAYYALIIRSLVTLEGIAINVDPNFKVLSKAYPYVSKRLLTDPAPQLRNSLQGLLFKDGTFRWNRLENLLRNARDSQDYDINFALNQAVEFIFSERGEFIREFLVTEIINNVDTAGRSAIDQVTNNLRSWVGLQTKQPKKLEIPGNAEHLARVIDLLRSTPGFDPAQLLPIVPRLLAKPEARGMGQEIIGGLGQRVAARMIRELLLNGRELPESSTPTELPEQRALPAVAR